LVKKLLQSLSIGLNNFKRWLE